MKDDTCNGEHRFFALELIALDSTDKRTVIIPLICTACGELKTHTIEVK